MKKYFDTHLNAIQWISDHAKNETHFEVLREELVFNHIYTEKYFIHLVLVEEDIDWMKPNQVSVLSEDQRHDDINTWSM